MTNMRIHRNCGPGMRTLSWVALLLLPCGALAAPAMWGPTWSEVTGNLWSGATLNRTAAIIKKIDGKHEVAKIVKTEPGKRVVVVQSPTRKRLSGTDVTMELDLVPCKRYYINAQFKSGSGREWEPVIVMSEPIAGCKMPKPAS